MRTQLKAYLATPLRRGLRLSLKLGLRLGLILSLCQTFSENGHAETTSPRPASPAHGASGSARGCAIADRFQSSPTSQSITRHIERIGGRIRTSGGRCYSAVQNALHRSGAIPYSGIGAAARDAETHLSQFGFVNLMTEPACRDRFRTPADAPDGAVLVYRGGNCPPARRILCGREDCGHVEIRVGSRYISDYASSRPVTGADDAISGGGQRCAPGRGFELIGILVPQS
jgi:hypothetical protein